MTLCGPHLAAVLCCAQQGGLQHQLRRTVLTSCGAGEVDSILIRLGVIPRPVPDEWEHFFPTTILCKSKKVQRVLI